MEIVANNTVSRGRLLLLAVVFFGMMLVLLGRLCYLQIFQGYIISQEASEQSVREIRVSAMRGRIYDAENNVVVKNRPAYDVSFQLSDMRQPGSRKQTIDYVLETSAEIAAAIGRKQSLSREDVTRRLRVYPALSWDVYEDLNERELSIAGEMMPNIAGVDFEVDYARKYEYPGVATHVLGFTGRRRPPESSRRRNYSYVMPELRGRAGLEKTFDDHLSGTPGLKTVRVDTLGYVREELSTSFEPTPGSNLYLTLDIKAQKIAEELLGDRRGAFVVVDVKSGAVKVLASSPTYNAARLTGKRYRALRTREEDRPLVNRALGQSYLPGSIIKPLVGLAALESEAVKETHTVYCDGAYEIGNVPISCWRNYGHGELDMVHAIKQSCNSYFIDIGMETGFDDLRFMFNKAGFGKKPGIELPGTVAGRLPSHAWMWRNFDRGWLPIETAYISIGQFALNVSPLQAAVYTAAIANGGTVYRPYIVKEIRSDDGDMLQQTAPLPVNHLMVSRENLQVIQKGMYLVVNSDTGTAEAAANDAVSVAGKTGTAQVLTPGDKHDNAWFIAYAPADNPRYAATVLIEYGNSGGQTAAPLVGKFFERWLGSDN